MNASPAATLVALIADAARARVLTKVTLSKCHDRAVSRATLTPRLVRGAEVLQLETLRTADVADAAADAALGSMRTPSAVKTRYFWQMKNSAMTATAAARTTAVRMRRSLLPGRLFGRYTSFPIPGFLL